MAPTSPASNGSQTPSVPDEPDGHWKTTQYLAWARQSADRAEQFQLENREALAAVQLEQCVNFLEQALAADPDDVSVRCFLIGCLLRLHNFGAAKEQALFSLRKIAEEHAFLEDPLLHLAVAQSANRLGQHEDAIAFAQRAVTEYPLYPQPCATLGRALQRTGRSFAAKKMMESALGRDSDPRCPLRLSEANRRAVHAYLEGRSMTPGRSEDCAVRNCDLGIAPARDAGYEQKGIGSSAICGEGAIATRYGRTGVADEKSPSSSSSPAALPVLETRRLEFQQRDVAPCGATASPRGAGLCARSMNSLPEERYLGTHEVLIDNHVVNVKASSSSEVVGTLSAGSRIRVSGVISSTEDSCVWGRIHAPLTGWLALVNMKTSLRWTKQVQPPQQSASPRVRSLPFGRPREAGPRGSGIREAAVNDLERIFSGLMPASSSPLARKENGASPEPMVAANRCSRCVTCCRE